MAVFVDYKVVIGPGRYAPEPNTPLIIAPSAVADDMYHNHVYEALPPATEYDLETPGAILMPDPILRHIISADLFDPANTMPELRSWAPDELREGLEAVSRLPVPPQYVLRQSTRGMPLADYVHNRLGKRSLTGSVHGDNLLEVFFRSMNKTALEFPAPVAMAFCAGIVHSVSVAYGLATVKVWANSYPAEGVPTLVNFERAQNMTNLAVNEPVYHWARAPPRVANKICRRFRVGVLARNATPQSLRSMVVVRSDPHDAKIEQEVEKALL
jgi:hypothetical protein